MIRATLTQNHEGVLYAFRSEGHAGYAEEGYDIVCAAVSVLGINCINSLEKLCSIEAEVTEYADGLLAFRLPSRLSSESSEASHDAQLLMRSLRLGLESIAEEYPKNLSLSIHKRRETP